ncbi:ABC1 kinase family protein [Deferrisoma camini]|uniref:ABC1 kinase family protein n=1 Tax=Deferrisoma camini TaxID=1035120 RepID=UPI00046D1742|nr:AarF/UbiB family protein [Deferrisoma camini]
MAPPEPARRRRWARAVRLFLERAGPGFVKLGQVLSVRPDLVPEPLRRELEALQDRAAPVPWARVRHTLEQALGADLRETFRALDPRPVASASIAQVHRALLPSGRAVALKVLRPGVEREMARNLRLARRLSPVLGLWPSLRGRVDARSLWDEIERAARDELHLRGEGETAAELGRRFRGDPWIRVPRVFWGHTARRVLTTEWVEGHKISAPEARGHPSYPALAEAGARAFFRQVLEFGLFHADLHPANLLVTRDGRIAYVDFGIRGRLDPGERHAVLGTLAGMLSRDPALALRHLERLGVRVPEAHRSAFVQEVGRALDAGLGPCLGEVPVASIGMGLLRAARRHGVRFPHRHAVLVKALLSIEGTARMLHPGFSLERCARGYLRELALRRVDFATVAEALWRGTALMGLGGLVASQTARRSPRKVFSLAPDG